MPANKTLHITLLLGLAIPLFCYPSNMAIAQLQNSTALSFDTQPQIDEFIPEVTLDKQQIQDLRSILNRSIGSLQSGNVSEAITDLRIVDDQLRILED